MLKLKFFKRAKAIFSVLLPLFLCIGCVVVLTGENYVSFTFSIILPALVLLNIILLIYLLIKRRINVVFSVLSLLTFFCFFNFFLQFNSKNKENINDSVSVLSYNVKGFTHNDGITNEYYNHSKKILNFVEVVGPDIIVYQEFHYIQLKDLKKSYPYHFLGYREGVKKSTQIILSKYPIVNEGYVDFKETANNCMYADIEINGEVLRIYNVHLQSFKLNLGSHLVRFKEIAYEVSKISESERMRGDQVNLVKQHMKEFKGKTIICGDFNSTPYSSEYRSLRKGKKDSFIEKGNGLGMTYNLFGYPLRLDYILVDDTIEVLSHHNFKLEYSDHEPILTELKLN